MPSWMQRLCETYDSLPKGHGDKPLLPIAHTTQTAHLEVYLNENGDFLRARPTEKKTANTIIQCTSDSAGRTSGVAPHPLFDKLQYVAKGIPKSEKHFDAYVSQLRQWCDDKEFSDHKARAVLSYVEKGKIMQDLTDCGVFLDMSIKGEKQIVSLSKETWQKDLKLKDVFVRWFVEGIDIHSDISTDRNVQNNWTKYCLKIADKTKKHGMDIVTGRDNVPIENNHPSRIRNDGDRTKIISSNDTLGYTYKGRFTDADQACTIGYESTEKAHQALRWLIRNQGIHQGDWYFVAWSISGNEIMDPLKDPAKTLFKDDVDEGIPHTAESAAIKLNKRLIGIDKDVNTKHISMMVLDSTNGMMGRLAVEYYKEFNGSEYERLLNEWFNSFSWYRTEFSDAKKGKGNKPTEIVCPPSIDMIIESAYGTVDDKMKKYCYSRLFPCIIECMPIPPDILSNALRRASNPLAFDSPYKWEKVISTACALYRGDKLRKNRGENKMTLDKDRRSRSYLYGRLLAVAHELEKRALYSAKEDRQTNAMRMMQKFSERPYSTWMLIYEALAPYRPRVKYAEYFDSIISEIMDIFDIEDFTDNRRLDGEYILAFYTQSREFRYKKDKEED